MSQRRTLTYPSADGRHTIRAVEWLPDGTPRGVLQIVHGIAEHMGRYAHVAEFFTRRGYVVCGEDHLGHGATVTDGKYGFFAPEGGWDLVVRDVYALRRLEGERWPDLPYVLLGHSMGSFWPGPVSSAGRGRWMPPCCRARGRSGRPWWLLAGGLRACCAGGGAGLCEPPGLCPVPGGL